MAESYDMHIHSSDSDGKKSPREIAAIAKEKGLEGIAITDHDTIFPSDHAQMLSKEYGIEIISGAEIGVKIELSPTERIYLEILTYFFDDEFSPKIRDICKINVGRRAPRMNEMIAKVNKECNSNLKIEDLRGVVNSCYNRQHLAELMHERGIVGSVQDAFDIYLDRRGKKSCFVDKEGFDINLFLDELYVAGGLGFIAHVGLISKDYELSEEDLLRYFEPYIDPERESRIIGMECDYPYFNSKRTRQKLGLTKEEIDKKIEFWRNAAEKYGLINLRGTDSHQREKDFQIGEIQTPKSVIEKLRQIAQERESSFKL